MINLMDNVVRKKKIEKKKIIDSTFESLGC